jgi:hypothetical protein
MQCSAFQICDFTQSGDHPLVYLAKFDDIKNTKAEILK